MTRAPHLPAWILQALYLAARPLLFIHFVIYSHTVSRGIFPDGDPAPARPGPDPVRFLFVGDIAVSGFGVLHDGMAVPAQAAAYFASETTRGASWHAVGTPSLRAVRAQRLLPQLDAFDVAVVMLGIPDVLLITRSTDWGDDLERLVAAIRSRYGADTRVVLAGIPPMQDFRPIAPAGRAVIVAQIARLNRESERVASALGAEFVPFPSWRVSEMLHEQVFSFRTMHRMWAQALAPAMVRAASPARPAAPAPLV